MTAHEGLAGARRPDGPRSPARGHPPTRDSSRPGMGLAGRRADDTIMVRDGHRPVPRVCRLASSNGKIRGPAWTDIGKMEKRRCPLRPELGQGSLDTPLIPASAHGTAGIQAGTPTNRHGHGHPSEPLSMSLSPTPPPWTSATLVDVTPSRLAELGRARRVS